MSEDANLTDFLGADSGDAAGEAEDAAESDDDAGEGASSGDSAGVDSASADLSSGDPTSTEAGDAEGDEAESAGIDPIRPTYAWGADRTCAGCGDRIDRAWREGDDYVCGSCKDW